MKIHVKTRPKVLCAENTGGDLIEQIKALYGRSWDLVTAKDGRQALEIVQNHGEQIRLAIVHSLLPIISGENLCLRMKEDQSWKKIPIILVGENGDECPPALKSRGVEFINRPFFRARLAESVDRCLASLEKKWLSFQPTRPRALLVDDTPHVRRVLRRYLEKMDIEVHEAESGRAMETVLEKRPPDFILLDVMMPIEDGLKVLKRLRANPENKHLPVIMVSGLDESEVIADALELGAVDYITKPICHRRFRARIKSCLDGIKLRKMEERRREELVATNSVLQSKVDQYMQGLKDSHHGMIFALSKLAESRDPETGEHLERLQGYCRILCESLASEGRYAGVLTEDFVENLVAASPLHDIGKVGIPDAVLLKPGRLTADEFEIMKQHSQIGADTLSASARNFGDNPLMDMGIEITQFHHEKWDGSGYPTGLSGESIPLSARILALGDVYDALTSKRVYKDAFSHEKSRSIILEGRGSHFDPAVVDAFLRVEDRFREIRQTCCDSEAKEILIA
jgi:cyclic di-GMP phosphodiesterase